MVVDSRRVKHNMADGSKGKHIMMLDGRMGKHNMHMAGVGRWQHG